MSASLNSDQSTEVEFISGVTASGLVSSHSFASWNEDAPATYSSTQSYAAKWGQPTAGAPGVVSYAFASASNWTAVEQAAFTATMHLWSAEAGITFTAASSSASADFVITRGVDGAADGGVTRLYLGAEGTTHLGRALQGEISIDTSVAGFGPVGGGFSNYGGYPWTVLLHEEGHVLGLGHAGAYDDGVTATPAQLTGYDNRAWSLMSYIGSDDAAVQAAASTPAGGFHWGVSAGSNGSYYYDTPTTPMALDILAAQRLYGLPTSTPLAGGQVFGFNTNITGDIRPFFDFAQNSRPVVTLWDEGAGNTLDLSGFSAGSSLNLSAGSFSSCAGLTNNLAIAFNTAIDRAIAGPGADFIRANADGDTILGGAGADTIMGGGNPAGTMEMLFGNQGDDVVTSSSPGSVELFGGQNNDTLIISSSGQGVSHYLFGNLGDDTLTAAGGYNSLYGGQGNDVLLAGGDGAGHNFLSGDLGDDVISAGAGGFDTLRGGVGADAITLSAHASGGPDTVVIGSGDSTAQSNSGESNLDHIAGFDFSRDRIVIAGHPGGATSNVVTYVDATSNNSEAQAFASAYIYAYGDGSAHAAHLEGASYLAVQESYGGNEAIYLFTADHVAVALSGETMASLQANAIVGS